MKYNITDIHIMCNHWRDNGYERKYGQINIDKFKEFVSTWTNRKDYNLLVWDDFISQFKESLRKSAIQIRSTAPSANIIEVLNLGYNEVKHSRMLAWLLDKSSTHQQDSVFFEYFLSLLKLGDKKYHKFQYEVSREWPERIDLSIYAKGKFCIFIENKVRHSL